MDSQGLNLDEAVAGLGSRWEIVQSGVTVKLDPSCAATHPPLDLVLAMMRDDGLAAANVAAIDVEVDSMTPRLLIHPDPATPLEAKFSMPFCAAAAVVFGGVGLDTFEPPNLEDPAVRRLMPSVSLHANPAFDDAAPLSRARVTMQLHDGRVLTREADGARGYPGRLTDEELAAKFDACARPTLTSTAAAAAWTALQDLNTWAEIAALTARLV